MRPLIGVTPDEGTSDARPGRPPLPRYELKRAYTDAVFEAGGLPLVLAYTADEEAIAQYVQTIDALVVTGGAFDIAPEEYGHEARAGLGTLKPVRTRFERRLMELALERGLPVLGVCGGMQLLNVVAGGTLVQDIPSEIPDPLQHEQKHDPREPAHPVELEAGSLLAKVCGVTSLGVNTTHHQAVGEPGRGLRVCGRAPDGVVEAIESTTGAFVLGVQWHPELMPDPAQRAIYRAFVAAARRP